MFSGKQAKIEKKPTPNQANYIYFMKHNLVKTSSLCKIRNSQKHVLKFNIVHVF